LSNQIYVEHANREYSVRYQDYMELIKSIENYPDVNQEQFDVKIYKTGEEGSNTYSLFIYGYKITIDLTLIIENSEEYLGKILCRLSNDEATISELYIDQNSSLIDDKDAIYPKGYIGKCGKQNTAMRFLTMLAKKVIEKTIPTA
jgi:hypothetical protein